MRTLPAQITFVESPRGGRWTVKFLHRHNVIGMILGRKVAERQTASILELREITNIDGKTHYEWKTPGTTHPSGNRHEWTDDLSQAQDRILDWAARRFRVPA